MSSLSSSAEVRSRWLKGLIGGFTLCLMGVTWPLWSASLSWDSPRIPWWECLTTAPPLLDGIGLSAALLGAAGLVVTTWSSTARVRIFSPLLFVLGIGLLVSLDQHRLQPWVVQFLLFGLFALFASGEVFLRGARWMVIAIYLWSAISKMDVTFLSQQGQLFLNGLLDPLGIDHTYWSPAFKQRIAAGFPAGELLTALLLLSPRTRRWGLVLSVLLHTVLIGILAFGLGHEWGVLIWNVYFILQNLILFRPISRIRPATVSETPFMVRRSWNWSWGIPLFAITYPALELAGACDHWPAWGVYCARPAQVKILIPDYATENLPDQLKSHLGLPAPLDERLPLSLDAWCFETRRCPIYPQERYRLALAVALLKSHLAENAIAVEIRSTPNRWTGARTLTTLNGFNEIEQHCRKQFLLNTTPRQSPQ